MSFIDALKKSLSGVGAAISNAFSVGGQAQQQSNKAIYDMATAAFDDHKSIGDAWGSLLKAAGNTGNVLGAEAGVLGAGIDSNPVTRGISSGLETAYREGISRPISTLSLNANEASRGADDSWKKLFDGDAWAKAYDASATISPGQALAGGAGLSDQGAFGEAASIDQIKAAQADGQFDKGALKWTSGTLDFASRSFLDPSILGGKAVKLARLGYVKPLAGAAVAEGAATKFTLSKRFDRVAEVVQKSGSADEVRVRLLNDNSNGAAMASVLFNVRHDPELLRIATRAAYGEADAFSDLNAYNQALIAAKEDAAPGMQAAADIGRIRRGDPAIARRQRVGTTDEQPGDWEDYVNLMKTDKNVFDQAVTMSPQLMQAVKDQPLVSSGKVALPQMRDSLSSRLRFSLHQASFSDAQPSLVRSPLESITRTWLVPSNRRIHGINLIDDNSDKAVRAYLDRAGMPQAQKAPLLDRYMAATGNNGQRAVVMAQIEDAAIRHIGSVYGVSPKDVEATTQAAAKGAGRAREIMANKHEFMAADLAETQAEQGNVISWIDEDGTRQIMPTPALESQLQDIYPVADPSAVHSAMKNSQSLSRNVGSTVVSELSNFGDKVHRLWKPTVLLGLGWPVRAGSDEVARSIALFGLGSQVLGIGKGFQYSAENIAEKGATRWDAYVKGQNRDRIQVLQRVMDPEMNNHARFIDLAHAYSNGMISSKELVDTTTEAVKKGLGDPIHAGLWRGVADGVMTRKEFGDEVISRALAKNEKNWYKGPFNQRGIVDQVLAEGKASVDPMTGMDYAPGAGTKIIRSKVLKPDEVTGRVHNDAIHDFVNQNLDHLIPEDAGITMTHLGDGAIKIDAHAQKLGFAERRLIAKRELKDFPNRAARSANRPVLVKLGNGQKIAMEGAMEGAGHGLMKQASGDDVYSNYLADQHELLRDRIGASAGWSNAISPSDGVQYPRAWERAANAQLGNDRAARGFLEGSNFDTMKHWAENDPDGQDWARATAFTGDIDTRLARTQAMVEQYVPNNQALRDKVLKGRATFADLHKVVPDDSLKPQIHGELLDYNTKGSKTVELVRKSTHKLMEKMGTIPGDKFSRYPFLDKAYRAHVADMTKLEFNQTGEITNARKFEIQQAARKKALYDVKKWLYNSDMVSEGTSLIRHFSPFSAAWQDGMRAWSGIAFRERPEAIGALNLLWNAPERAGMIVDQDGRQLKKDAQGADHYYEDEIDPQTDMPTGKRIEYKKKPGDNTDKYLQFALPTWLTPDQIGGPHASVNVRINKDSFNTFMHLDPGAGPIVTVPTSYIVQKWHPEWGQNEIVKRILPFGPSNDATKNAMSNELRQVYENWKGEDDSTWRNQAMAILQTESIRYNQGQRTTKPTMQEATDKANSLKLMRTVLTSVLPVSPTFTSPYQAHIDAYKQLEARDPGTADQQFYNRYGDDFFILTARVTQGVKGLPPTMESYSAIKKYRDMIEKNPDIAGAIVGDVSGSFNKAVYEWQKQEQITPGSKNKFRELMDMRDSVEDAGRRLSWIKYQNTADVIHAELSARSLTNVNAKGAEDLKQLQDGIVQQLGFDQNGAPTKWFEDYSGGNQAKQAKVLSGLRMVASDPTLLNREDIQGLADYFVMRDDFTQQLQARADAGGAKTLAAKKNADIQGMWEQAVFGLKEQNLTFARLYDRYLTSDNLKV